MTLGIDTASTLEIDAGRGSLLTIGNAGGLTNSGTVRVVCGADATAANTPITVNGSGWTGTQAVGGTWNSGTGLFTPSAVVTGTLGSATSIDTSVNQRALWTDANGNTLGASFLAATSSNPITRPSRPWAAARRLRIGL